MGKSNRLGLAAIAVIAVALLAAAALVPLIGIGDINGTEDEQTLGADFTITYNPNGAPGNPVVDGTNIGFSYQIKYNQWNFPGRIFDSWNTLPDGKGVKHNPGSIVSVTGNINLYAIWKPNFTFLKEEYVAFGAVNKPFTAYQMLPFTNLGVQWSIADQSTDLLGLTFTSQLSGEQSILFSGVPTRSGTIVTTLSYTDVTYKFIIIILDSIHPLVQSTFYSGEQIDLDWTSWNIPSANLRLYDFEFIESEDWGWADEWFSAPNFVMFPKSGTAPDVDVPTISEAWVYYESIYNAAPDTPSYIESTMGITSYHYQLTILPEDTGGGNGGDCGNGGEESEAASSGWYLVIIAVASMIGGLMSLGVGRAYMGSAMIGIGIVVLLVAVFGVII